MYVSKCPYIIFREYPYYGYLTDNRNFGYDTQSKSMTKVGDRVISKSGCVFYSVLSEVPEDVTVIVSRLMSIFTTAPYDVISCIPDNYLTSCTNPFRGASAKADGASCIPDNYLTS